MLGEVRVPLSGDDEISDYVIRYSRFSGPSPLQVPILGMKPLSAEAPNSPDYLPNSIPASVVSSLSQMMRGTVLACMRHFGFLVVWFHSKAESNSFYLCSPILTYERRGCTKRGVKPRTHGIVYQLGSRPV